MADKKFAVLFDTNSYRQFVSGKKTNEALCEIKALKKMENRKNIQAYGVMVVALEMLGNLAEGETGVNYRDCLNGLLAMIEHCSDGHGTPPRYTLQPALHIANSFFGGVPQEIENRAKNLMGIAEDLSRDLQTALKHHQEKGTFNTIRTYIDNEEQVFSTTITDFIEGVKQKVVSEHPRIADRDLRTKLLAYIQTKEFESIIAKGIIVATAQKLNQGLPEQEIDKRALKMMEEFPLSAGFHQWICHKIVHDTIDMQSSTSRKKRWNWLWDYQVAFLVNKHTLDGREVILVTSDGDLIKMLKDCGYNNKVLTITQYIDFVKSSGKRQWCFNLCRLLTFFNKVK
ncbi:MAG: hypothetical protein H9535_05655 [Ignavibacteria bacterium]|nr:hypothetical protein [Ignavibacteria bacterium]